MLPYVCIWTYMNSNDILFVVFLNRKKKKFNLYNQAATENTAMPEQKQTEILLNIMNIIILSIAYSYDC